MKYCLKCARQIGDEHSFCPYCGSSQKWEKNIESEKNLVKRLQNCQSS
ncbi:zinc-ribbon domain-containing protein [Fibrobacter sp. UWP2]